MIFAVGAIVVLVEVDAVVVVVVASVVVASVVEVASVVVVDGVVAVVTGVCAAVVADELDVESELHDSNSHAPNNMARDALRFTMGVAISWA